jgi:cytochrome oxidase assembly protein ShyY1
VGHRVTLSGRWLPDAQVAVLNREGGGKPGVWIVTALQLDSGPAVAVVRGWLPTATSPGFSAARGPVEVDGVVQLEEKFYTSAVTSPGTIASLADLSTALGLPVLPGYVVLTDEQPTVTPAPVPVPVTVSTDVPFPLRNFVYALQWWVFGLFAVAVFVRWMWRDNTVH